MKPAAELVVYGTAVVDVAPPLTAAELLNPMLAGAAMAFSSVFVSHQQPAPPEVPTAMNDHPQRGYSLSKADYTKRLNRIEGQVRGIRRMIDEDTGVVDGGQCGQSAATSRSRWCNW